MHQLGIKQQAELNEALQEGQLRAQENPGRSKDSYSQRSVNRHCRAGFVSCLLGVCTGEGHRQPEMFAANNNGHIYVRSIASGHCVSQTAIYDPLVQNCLRLSATEHDHALSFASGKFYGQA